MHIKNIMLALLITAAAMAGSTGMARAEEDSCEAIVKQEQECRQEFEQECETGAYGQSTNCKQKAEQVCKQEQTVKVCGKDDEKGEVLAKVHEPVETALDLQTTLAAAAILTTGAGAYTLKRKIK